MVEHDPAALARRLRRLREGRWPGWRLTQQQVANALGVALSSVSSWENTRATKIPPATRLADYAVLFATERSFQGELRLLRPEDLTEDERAVHDELAAELYKLRAAAAGETAHPPAVTRSLWRFDDGGPVRLICGLNPDRPRHASARHHNYMQLAGYADLDSLVELFGHVRAQNPDADVRFDLEDRLESDDMKSHLVVLGGEGMNKLADWTADMIELPVEQEPDPKIKDGEIFRLKGPGGTTFRPRFVGNDPDGEVTEDVGLFVRTPNPSNSARTLTLCNGVFTRGVYGAVRMLTDLVLRDQNQAALHEMFGDAPTFGLLMRVPIFNHATGTPDLRNPRTILHSWSTGPES